MNIQTNNISTGSRFNPYDQEASQMNAQRVQAQREQNWQRRLDGEQNVGSTLKFMQADSVDRVRGVPQTGGMSQAVQSVSNELLQSANRTAAQYPQPHERLLASSDNESTATVSNINSAAEAGTSMRVNVVRTAQAQENPGRLFAQGAQDFNEGTNRLSVNTNEGRFDINVNVREGDTNERVIERTAQAVNRRDMGINAEVNRQGAAVSLNLASERTGTQNAFTVEQTSFADRVGVTQAATEARNAVFSVNGGAAQSQSNNEAYLGRGVTATLQNEGFATVEVDRAHNHDEQEEQGMFQTQRSDAPPESERGREGQNSRRMSAFVDMNA